MDDQVYNILWNTISEGVALRTTRNNLVATKPQKSHEANSTKTLAK